MAGTLHVQVDVELPAAWTVFFGHSGAGKTSLLRLLAGLWRPVGARVVLGGVDVTALPPHRRRAVLVAQQAALFPHRSVRGNVAFGARDQTTTEAMVQRFQLGALAARHVSALSGGEAQRVCLARAMAAAPRLLLLDESFTGLDRGLREELLRTLRELQKDRGMPIVSVTHDVGEAFACADEVLRIEAGRVTARGSAAEVLAPERAALLQRLSGQPA